MKFKPAFYTEIAIDEEKVLREGEYKLEEMYEILDTIFAKYHLPRVEAEGNVRIYRNGNSSKDFAHMWNINTLLREKRWFACNVYRWLWYLNENPEDPDDYMVEDLYYHYILPRIKDGIWMGDIPWLDVYKQKIKDNSDKGTK